MTDSASCVPLGWYLSIGSGMCTNRDGKGGKCCFSSASLVRRSQPAYKTRTCSGFSETVKPCPKKTPHSLFHFGFPPLGGFFLCFRKVLFVPTMCIGLVRPSSLTHEPAGLFGLDRYSSWIRTPMNTVAILTLVDPLMSSLIPIGAPIYSRKVQTPQILANLFVSRK